MGFFQHRRLRVPHGDDLAAAHLTVAEVHELHRLAKMEVRTRGNATAWAGQHALDQCLELVELQAACALEGFNHSRVGALQAHCVFLLCAACAMAATDAPGSRLRSTNSRFSSSLCLRRVSLPEVTRLFMRARTG